MVLVSPDPYRPSPFEPMDKNIKIEIRRCLV